MDWRKLYLGNIRGIDSILPGIIVNNLVFLSGYYILLDKNKIENIHQQSDYNEGKKSFFYFRL